MKIEVFPLTPDRWSDLESIFNAKGCSMARGCWCMYYRQSGKQSPLEKGETFSERNRQQLKALAELDPPPGLIGYDDGEPVGWLSLGPRKDFLKLKRSSVMKRVDDQSVWSIVCFVVPSEHREKGIARAMLKGAVEYCRERGVSLLEAYPLDKSIPDAGESTWFGSKSMYDEAGFVEVARRKPERPIVRLNLL